MSASVFAKLQSLTEDGEFRVLRGVIPTYVVTAQFVNKEGQTFQVSIVHDADGALVSGIDGEAEDALTNCYLAEEEIEVVSDLLTPPEPA